MERLRSLLVTSAAGCVASLIGTASYAQAADTTPPPPNNSTTALSSKTVPNSTAVQKPADVQNSADVTDIVVTGEKTGERLLQHTPVAIYAITKDQLQNSLVNNVTDLVQMAPSLNVAETSVGAQIYIRGIGTNDVFAGGDPDVTTQIDGVYIANSYAQFADFIDVQRIEVLRGPQGTLYGRNAIGGTINIISRAPGTQFHATEQLTVGTYNLLQEQAYVTGPLSDKAEASLAINYLRHDFWSKNVANGPEHGIDNRKRGGFRAQVRVHPSETVDATTRVDFSAVHESPDFGDHLVVPFATTPIANSTIGHNKVALTSPQWAHQQMGGISEEINGQLSDVFQLKSLTAYRYNHSASASDTDGTELAINVGHQFDTTKQFSEELNLIAHTDRFSGIVGAYYFWSDDKANLQALGTNATGDPTKRLFSNLFPHIRTDSRAVFAQGTYNFTDQLSLLLGARYTIDKKNGTQLYERNTAAAYPVLGPPLPGFPFRAPFSKRYHAFTPKVTLSWQATPNHLFYVTAAEGYKSGGMNYAANTLAALAFAPEKLWDYEAGAKTSWFEHRLVIDLAAFDYKYTNMQVTSLLGPGVVAIANAASATIRGVEGEITARPTPDFSAGAKFSFLDAKYDTFPHASIPGAVVPLVSKLPGYDPSTTPATYNAAGNHLNAAPSSSFTLWADWRHPLGGGTFTAHAEVYHQSRAFYDPSNVGVLSQAPYTVANASVGYTPAGDHWDVKLIGQNIFNERYFIAMNANTTPVGFQSAPRTVAIRVAGHW